jgi:hypothetical protein
MLYSILHIYLPHLYQGVLLTKFLREDEHLHCYIFLVVLAFDTLQPLPASLDLVLLRQQN